MTTTPDVDVPPPRGWVTDSEMDIIAGTAKTCSVCAVQMCRDNFSRDDKMPDGRKNTCKWCVKKRERRRQRDRG